MKPTLGSDGVVVDDMFIDSVDIDVVVVACIIL
jgi:hypothetical protein